MNQPLLELKNISVRYERKVVLQDISLCVYPNDMLHVCGANGGGKTTLVRVMAGLLKPYEGEVLKIPNLTIGYLPQYRRIDRQFPISVQDAVLSGMIGKKSFWQSYSAEMRSGAQSLMERCGVLHLQHKPISNLSGGQWQRTLIARALAADPQLLILDEPDTHLDREGKNFLKQLLEEEAGSRAVVIVSHDHEFLPQSQYLRLINLD